MSIENNQSKPFGNRLDAHIYLRGLPKPKRYLSDTCIIYIQHVTMGDNIGIGDYSVIGKEGFGFDPQTEYSQRWNHIGKVIIKDNVEIGANTCVDRGVLTDTIIEENVKIDNLVHVAHGVVIEKNSVIVAGTILGGSCHIGKNVFIGMNASIRDNITIGDRAFIGMGCIVTKSVPAYERVKPKI